MIADTTTTPSPLNGLISYTNATNLTTIVSFPVSSFHDWSSKVELSVGIALSIILMIILIDVIKWPLNSNCKSSQMEMLA